MSQKRTTLADVVKSNFMAIIGALAPIGYESEDGFHFGEPPEERKIIKLDHLREVFCDGQKRLELQEAAHDLATLVEVTDSAAYNALKSGWQVLRKYQPQQRFAHFSFNQIP